MPTAPPSAGETAVVLAPREVFSPDETSAVGRLVQQLATAPGAEPVRVYGIATARPFPGVAFQPVRPAWRIGGRGARYGAGVAKLLLARKPRLIEVQNRPDLARYLARRLPDVPVLLLLHNEPRGMRRARTPDQRADLLERIACVAGVSDDIRQRFLEGVRSDRPVEVLHNCIDLRDIPPSPPEREKVFRFAGRVIADKGVDAFVRACALALPRLPGWRAEVLGGDWFGPNSGETAFLAGLRPLAQAAGVQLAGWQPHGQILAAMARAAVVVVPSRWREPFGLTALEAMACGAALLCSQRGGLREVSEGVSVPIDPDNPAQMAEAMVALAQDPDRRAALGAAARARAGAFDVTHAAARLAALRSRLVATWPRGRERTT